MTNEEIRIIKEAFESYNGKQALDIIKRMSGIETRTKYNPDERKQAYDLGRASLFQDIITIITTNKKKVKNERTER